MTPTLLALSRAYMALPGAPVRDMIADELVNRTPDGHPRYRDRAGLLWCPDTEADRPAPWLLDLTDAATGGVMVARFSAVAVLDIRATRPTADAVRWWGYWLDGAAWRDVPQSDHLAEFGARAAVALGRAG